jgi:hypothetical protein
MVVSTSLNYDSTHCNKGEKREEKKDEQVILTKDEVIDILKTLEGIKRRLQPRVR